MVQEVVRPGHTDSAARAAVAFLAQVLVHVIRSTPAVLTGPEARRVAARVRPACVQPGGGARVAPEASLRFQRQDRRALSALGVGGAGSAVLQRVRSRCHGADREVGEEEALFAGSAAQCAAGAAQRVDARDARPLAFKCCFEHFPAAESTHEEAPACACVPGEHSKHLARPLLGAYEPGAHASSREFDGQNEPAERRTQSWTDLQSRQMRRAAGAGAGAGDWRDLLTSSDASACVPAGQGSGADDPAVQ
eukprot:3175874-Rhodomonas_salina.2